MKKLLLLSLAFISTGLYCSNKAVINSQKMPTKSAITKAALVLVGDTAFCTLCSLILGDVFQLPYPAMTRMKWGAIMGALVGTNRASSYLLADMQQPDPAQNTAKPT